MGSQKTPYWNVNVPPALHTPSPPPFLATLGPKDREIISQSDAQFHIQTWPEVQHIVRTNQLDVFQRVPSQLRRYYEFNWQLKEQYGSVMNFILSQRLHWETPIQPSGSKPFADPDNDVKILRNDWPYALAEGIVHLVVWTKFELEADPVTDDVTDQSRAEIDAFVRETFTNRVGEDNIIWFKNWKSLKSVHAVEHFHVMLNKPNPEFVKEISGGDIALSEKV